MARATWPPRFLFHSGRLCLDFAHTGGEGAWAKFERWNAPSDLADWLEASALGVRVSAVRPGELREARVLRRAIWNGARALVAGRVLPRASASELVRFAARADLVPKLAGGELAWSEDGTAARALSNVARDALALFGTSARERLRECANPNCPLLFVDTSRPGKRQWCSMRRCGNLEKTARYRARRRDR